MSLFYFKYFSIFELRGFDLAQQKRRLIIDIFTMSDC